MDTFLEDFPNSMNGFFLQHGLASLPSNKIIDDGYELNHNLSNSHPSLQPLNSQSDNELTSSPSSSSSSSSSPSSSWPSSEVDNPNNSVVLKCISDMLMEEDLEGKNCMLQDCLALQAAEKSLYDVLGQEYPHSSNQLSCRYSQHVESLDSINSFPTPDTSFGTKFIFGNPDPNLDPPSSQNSFPDSSERTLLGPDFPSQIYPFGNFKIGESSKFLLDVDSLIVSPESNSSSSPHKKYLQAVSRGRKNHQREDSHDLEEEEERSNKHSAISLADPEQTEMFDDVLLCRANGNESTGYALQENSPSGRNEQRKGSNGRTARSKKQGNKREVVDLPTLLTQCAQSVSINDQRAANDLLKQIRNHASPYGDGNQRLAYYFANALETRLAGIKLPTYTPIVSNKTSAADILKAYQVYIKACPFKRMSIFFANRTILKLAEKATSLHIIDFGILYGFQWPCLIQRLSERPSGPPKLRITGIELPQPGFRPTERVEETGRRLERYCKRFRVPFEFNVIAQKWETIRYEDLNVDRDEMTVVNCLYRLRHLPDDTVVANSARDTVLELIKTIRPEIFIHGVVNGTYNAPFFLTRFREALYHYSSLFDMLEVTVAQEDEHRRMFEDAIYGREAMNVIACEGTERIDRPETYKQWRVRNLRGGFRQLPLDQEILKKMISKVRSEYHKDFVVDQDGHWMLQGWKGRIIHALSVWKPT